MEDKATKDSALRGKRRRRTMNTGRGIRLSGPERQEQIANTTLMIIARHGLAGATLSRIGDAVGMEAPSLYAHFSSRDDMLLAALEVLREKFANHTGRASKPDMLERMRELGRNHPEIVDREFDGLVVPIFEFITAPRDSGLGEAAGKVNLDTFETLKNVVEEGKRQGTIRPDLDSRVAAYEWLMLYWAADITRLMGLDEFLADDIYGGILELFLRDMSPSPESLSPETSDDEEASGEGKGNG
jgi:AcrR family transcriptional regulator